MAPFQSRSTTRVACRRARATVSSVLCESTTTISSAQETDESAASMSAASFLVMTVTESFGTARSVTEAVREGGKGRKGGRAGRESSCLRTVFSPPAFPALPALPALPAFPARLLSRDAADLERPRSRRRDAGAKAEQRHELDGLEVHERLVVVGNR